MWSTQKDLQRATALAHPRLFSSLLLSVSWLPWKQGSHPFSDSNRETKGYCTCIQTFGCKWKEIQPTQKGLPCRSMKPEEPGLCNWKVQRDYANCTLLSQIISGKVKDSQVSNPRIAQRTPALVNQGVSFKAAPQEPVAPYELLVEREVCAFPFPKLEKVSGLENAVNHKRKL